MLSCPICGGKLFGPVSKQWSNCIGDKAWSAEISCPKCNLSLKTQGPSFDSEIEAIEAIESNWNKINSDDNSYDISNLVDRSYYFELFGTSERAIKTLKLLCDCFDTCKNLRCHALRNLRTTVRQLESDIKILASNTV